MQPALGGCHSCDAFADGPQEQQRSKHLRRNGACTEIKKAVQERLGNLTATMQNIVARIDPANFIKQPMIKINGGAMKEAVKEADATGLENAAIA